MFQRVAGGSSAKAEANRLAALGIPNRQRYGPSEKHPQGRVIERPSRWRYSTVQNILHNPIYKGEGIKRSQFGDVSVPAPALVDAVTWQAAQDALLRNRRLSTKNSQHTYLLRGLIRCANCGAAYTGSARRSTHDRQPITVRRYCCAGQSDHNKGSGAPRCPGKVLHANWLEDAVWEECRRFIRNPGEALDEARRKLRERMTASAGFAEQRRTLLGQLAEKETERERVLTLFRKGTISDAEAERELDAIAKEAGQVREMIESMRAQTALIEAQEAFLTDSAALLSRLQDELADIDASNDQARKREVIEQYVRQITVETRRVGPHKLEADVRVFLRLKPEPIAVENGTRSRDGFYHPSERLEIERVLVAA
jgi:site-specific DNA recombinase